MLMEVKNIIKHFVPKSLDLPLRYYYLKALKILDDDHMLLKHNISNPNCAIDIGSNIGIYSYVLSQFCRKVVAFEPIMECTNMLRAYAEKKGNITIYNVALSNRSDNATLYVPLSQNRLNTGFASFNDPGGRESL